ncbi:chloride channel protein [Streptomyces sp. NBC_00320]|uniref:chloride channel protein n=1 Tax=Streptomyces sp. NBC_00320 TaxID=2975711 RepID=UPI002256D408|nr:chloride channel protein [Streptomyces sp. NBC_00320]MCX5149636.1 chloride channel protein [Streptomyces sp. NBC_00320]
MTLPTQPSPGPLPPPRPAEAQKLGELLRTPGYRKTLVFCGLIGIPVSLAAFWFLAGLRKLESLVWVDLPHALGHDAPPWWWPLPLLLVSGLCVGQIVTRLPGAGGHIPASGLHPGGSGAAALPGVILAAVFSLPLGATLGPEAPLIALGGGLAIALRHLTGTPETPMSTALLGAAGSAAAIATLFGNPLIGAVLLMEVVGVGGPQLFAVMLPALLSSGIGSLVFTGFGRWTGLGTGDLKLKSGTQFPRLDAGDVLWSILIAMVIACGVHLIQYGGRLTSVRVAGRPLTVTVLCALGAGACAAAYALGTGRSPADVASSGQTTLGQLAGDPHAWGVGALIAVLLCKGAAFSLCLGSLRGGPIFPSLFLGAAAGVLCSPLPGLGIGAGLAAGMAAATVTALRLPVSSVVLVVLVLGSTEMIPVAILAAVVAFVTAELLPPGPPVPPVGRTPQPAAPAAPAPSA